MKGRVNSLIRWLIPLACGLFIGLVLAVWITRLDPDGTGGSVLAMPALLIGLGISSISFIFGLATAYDPVGRKMLAFSFLIWPVLFIAVSILR